MVYSNKKIKRKFIKDEAYDIISELIVSGQLEPQRRIKIDELSEQLGISRTPVREAILQLENEGLIISKPNKWTIVAPININETLNIYPIISTLESLALRLAFDKIDDTFIKSLILLNKEIKDACDHANQVEILEKDNIFHESIIKLSGNTEIQPILVNLKKKVQRVEIYFFSESKDKYNSYYEHNKIIENLEDKNLDGAIEALDRNWMSTIKILKNLEYDTNLTKS